MSTSRLSRKTQSKRQKQLFLTLAGLGVISFLLFQFGIWAITGISSLFIWINERGAQESIRKNPKEVISAPTFDSLPEASDKNSITVTGIAPNDKGSVEIYLNDELYKEIIISNGKFKSEVQGLREGDNTIEARFITVDDRKSPFSKPLVITYTKEPPKLEIDFPSDGTIFRRGDEIIEIRGKTDPDNKVKINDFYAIVDGQGNFSYNFRLSEGDNLITIEAENKAGLKTSKQIKITFSP